MLKIFYHFFNESVLCQSLPFRIIMCWYYHLTLFIVQLILWGRSGHSGKQKNYSFIPVVKENNFLNTKLVLCKQTCSLNVSLHEFVMKKAWTHDFIIDDDISRSWNGALSLKVHPSLWTTKLGIWNCDIQWQYTVPSITNWWFQNWDSINTVGSIAFIWFIHYVSVYATVYDLFQYFKIATA